MQCHIGRNEESDYFIVTCNRAGGKNATAQQLATFLFIQRTKRIAISLELGKVFDANEIVPFMLMLANEVRGGFGKLPLCFLDATARGLVEATELKNTYHLCANEAELLQFFSEKETA